MAQSILCQSAGRARSILIAVSTVLAFFLLAPSIFRLGSSLQSPTGCPECPCKYQTDLASLPTVDCGKDDAEMREELDKSVMQLLREELELQATVAEEAQQRAELAFLDAKKTASQFQKEAEKCNAGMEMSEDARANAESNYADARKHAEIWEKRARDLGWKDSDSDSDSRGTNEEKGEEDNVKDREGEYNGREDRTTAMWDREERGSEKGVVAKGNRRKGKLTATSMDEDNREP